jgi:hypothetical protein
MLLMLLLVLLLPNRAAAADGVGLFSMIELSPPDRRSCSSRGVLNSAAAAATAAAVP